MYKILLLIGVCTISLTAIAQDKNENEQVRFGVKAGFNRSNVYDESGDHFVADDKIGFVGGAFLKIALNDHVGFQPEFMFAQKGFTATGNYRMGTYEFTRTTNFFEIPLLLEVKANKHFSLLIGPQYNYLLSTKDVYRNNTITVTDEEEYQMTISGKIS